MALLQHRVWIKEGRLHVIPPVLWSSCVEVVCGDAVGVGIVRLNKVGVLFLFQARRRAFAKFAPTSGH